jgi:predicted secreted hydrolase
MRRERRHDIRSGPATSAVALAAILVAGLVAGCSGGPILANPPAAHPTAPPSVPPPVALADPQPISFPADDGPHDRLTEWWYYTGHLSDEAGNRYGFEYVIFRAERGDFPVAWASHLAITDEAGDRFTYAQRSEIGPQVDRSTTLAGGGFALALTGLDPSRPETYAQPPWTMTGGDGLDRLSATATPTEAATAGSAGGLGLDLVLSATKPPALHDADGWIDFGPAGGSYYYSRTAMDASGSIVLDGRVLAVTGDAWFDHQWGDFIAVGGGGWDWFAINLEDGTDLTISLVRDRDGTYPLVYGTLVEADGTTRHLADDALAVEVLGEWTSPRTGARYPAGWRIRIPGERLDLTVTPTVRDQELDTRATTGVIYWEGSQIVSGRRGDDPATGRGYVELTGYAASTLAGR